MKTQQRFSILNMIAVIIAQKIENLLVSVYPKSVCYINENSV